ncbi:MAG: class I SAM-dependent methyltransferase [Gemmatimonadota bacterium]
MSMARPDYGLDAPGVVRNLLLVGIVGLALRATVAAGLWSGFLAFHPSASLDITLPLGYMALWPGLSCFLMGCWMIYTSKVGKVRERERVLDRIQWTGSEAVLDVGCGRGLMLVGAARRLTTGRATGVDIWQSEDLSGNRPDATLENARREGVAERVVVETADMRKLPFPDAAFDVALSCAAIHNVPTAEGRAAAIGEISRVLKPGGRAVIDDIRHLNDYAKTFVAHGCKAERIDSKAGSLLWTLITFGSLRPGLLMVVKG